jgi:hypothetical protein
MAAAAPHTAGTSHCPLQLPLLNRAIPRYVAHCTDTPRNRQTTSKGNAS